MKPQIILGVLLLCLNLSLFAQTIPAYVPEEDSVNIAYKNRLVALFENVDLSLVPSGVLYERGFPFIAIEAFTGQLADSSKANSMTFGLAYASIASMTVDSLLDLPGSNPGASELEITDIDGDPVIYTLYNFVTATCGAQDPTSPPYVPIGNQGGSYFPNTELTGQGDPMRLDSAIVFIHGQTTYWDATSNNLAAIGYYKDILTYSYSQQELADKRVQFHLKDAYNQMKTTVYKAFADSVLLKSNNQGAFDSNVQKYVDVLNHLTLADTVQSDEFRYRFMLEMDKSHLFRLLGKTDLALDIVQNLNLCPLDSMEQVAVNYWMFAFDEDLAKEQIGLTAYGVDTIYTDTTVIYPPQSTQITESYFGSTINSMSSITYRSCTGTKIKEDQEDVEADFAFTLYPNPSRGQINLSYDLPENNKAEIIVFAPDGKLVYRKTLAKDSHSDMIDISYVQSGIYIYSVIIDGEIVKTDRISILGTR